jgi:adenosylcobinamide-GDP ribazoletransferase
MSMRAALGFLTIVGGHAAPSRRAPAWFAVVGALVGAAVGLVWWGAGELWAPAVAAAVAVAADAALTGMLHLDGLADSADGLLPPLDRARRLAVMAAPDVGAFGVTVLVLVLVLRVAALASLDPDPLLLAGVWAAARAAMALTLATVPYARSGGLASAFAPAPVPAEVPPPAAPAGAPPASTSAGAPPASASAAAPPPAAPAGRRVGGGASAGAAGLGLAGGVALVVGAAGWSGVAAAGALVLGAGGVVALARRRIGGYTGDVLGAAGVVGETVALLAAAARW